ncbi:MAG: hypothetical protein WBQ26_08490 [Gemmatimonadaceae bacterium]|nr:hypothetical protein [Gemmatimonadaceae bacterium]
MSQFVGLSALITGFDAAELHGTGMTQTYFDLIPSIIGPDFFGRLLTRWANINARGAGDERLLEDLVTTELFEDAALGPIARNLAALWYLGMWNQLPSTWRNAHGAWAGDTTFVVSPQSYTGGLVWKALHTHPPAAKQPGFGSWALPPEGTQP